MHEETTRGAGPPSPHPPMHVLPFTVFLSHFAAVLEALKKRAEPPTEQEFIVTYQKCKYAINLVSKLGHHLSSPSPTQLLKGFFVYIREMVNMNQGSVGYGYNV